MYISDHYFPPKPRCVLEQSVDYKTLPEQLSLIACFQKEKHRKFDSRNKYLPGYFKFQIF